MNSKNNLIKKFTSICFKRFFCVLTAILLISANILNINFLYAYADENNKSVARDVVLVIDTSYSMEGQPIEAVKTASKQFCDDLLDSTDDNKVAIVLYAGNVYSKKEFTNNLSELHSYIDSIGLRSATNIYDALVSAKELLDNHTGREDAIKNIILLTDGLPHHSPPAEDDRYADLPSEGTGKNATYIYNYYTENLKNNYNVYTLGFYHKLNETLRPFANKFMSDIQNNGYYEVKDATKIRFAFKDIVKKINNSKCPIIVVPGIMGSRLFKGDDLVWVPEDTTDALKAISKYKKNMVISQELSVKGNYDKNGKPVNQALLPASQREYGAYDSSKVLIDGIIDKFTVNGKPERSVYIFSYDFRKSNSENAKKLKKFINDVLKANPNYSQVDVVAHSMGGLVLSSYVSSNGSDKLRRIITAATPYEGAPRMIQSTLTSKVLDKMGG